MNRRLILAGLVAAGSLTAACATKPPAPVAATLAGSHMMPDGTMMSNAPPVRSDKDPILGMPRDIKGPTLSFPEGGMFFYVENDGQHVVALDDEGKIRWRREPFVEYPAEGDRRSPIKSLTTPGYDTPTGHRVLLVKNAGGFRGLDMLSGDYLMG